jgi:hypothetical protein
MILEFLPEASAELYEAADYYESKQEGLGKRFRNEVLEVCGLIVQQPLLWRERSGGYRRVLSGFPILHRLFYPQRSDCRCSGRSRPPASGVLETKIVPEMTPSERSEPD